MCLLHATIKRAICHLSSSYSDSKNNNFQVSRCHLLCNASKLIRRSVSDPIVFDSIRWYPMAFDSIKLALVFVSYLTDWLPIPFHLLLDQPLRDLGIVKLSAAIRALYCLEPALGRRQRQ